MTAVIHVLEMANTVKTEEFTLFWGMESAFSQMHQATFFLEGEIFDCAEQYYMFKKAEAFGDARLMDQILAARHPKQQKRLGSNVQ